MGDMSKSFYLPDWLTLRMFLFFFAEQIYYAGPINNSEFDIPQVKFGFSALVCHLIAVLNSLFFLERMKG